MITEPKIGEIPVTPPSTNLAATASVAEVYPDPAVRVAIDTISAPELPEKADKLEKMAQAGLPVPRVRIYLPAKVFNNQKVNELLKGFDDARKKLGALDSAENFRIRPESDSGAPPDEKNYMLVRSAHPRESQFDGGAFESIRKEVKKSDKFDEADQLFGPVFAARGEIVNTARDSLQVDRNVKFKNIEGYKPEDMGVLVTEYIPHHISITVVPLPDGRISLRFFYKGNMEVLDINPDNIQGGFKEIEYQLKISPKNIPSSSEEDVSLVRMFADIKKAQKLFDKPQEMEILMQKDGTYTIVQSKTMAPKGQSPEIPTGLFEKGIQHVLGQSPMDGSRSGIENQKWELERAESGSDLRECQAIIIDEAAWLTEGEIPWKEEKRWEDQDAKDEFESSRESREILGRYLMRGKEKRDFRKKIKMILLHEYESRIQNAKIFPHYALFIKTMPMEIGSGHFDTLYEPFDEEEKRMSERIEICRRELISSADVQVRGMTMGDVKTPGLGIHVLFGATGPRQILLGYTNAEPYIPSSPLSKIKEGDRVIVMVVPRKGEYSTQDEASLYIPHLSE